ncbi:aminomethyl-transferring glycine dehydrogenase subunit GcvPA [Salinarimonas chemoclinalis]|uniref:aminomethyl-transferring glycine dehydrogenase subunit GcvPA n=1 Tax=Salinarimonas chemoclinalis TaxID=3241599 RepID=UPI0035587F43
MRQDQTRAHPWMPNSVPAAKDAMLAAIGANSIEQLFVQIPEDHRFRGTFDLPPALPSEVELKKHLLKVLGKNRSCEENLSFLGAGIYQHHVPAIVDEVAGRSEFLTSVWGTPMSDHGRNQAWFEFCAQLGELVGMDFVGLPVYSWGCAAGNAARMAARITGRRRLLVPASMDPERLAVVRQYCEPVQMASHIAVETIAFDPKTGLLDLDDLAAKLGDDVAGVYFESPGFLGTIESRGAEIAAAAKRHGAITIVGVDPISLGILAPPSDYGADIVVGTIQTLGAHMNCGGGAGGFIASRDEEAYAREYPTLNVSITGTSVPGEVGFGLCLAHQSSYGMREEGKDWTGNSVYLTAIASAVYMSLMGPEGFREIGELIIQRAHYAARRVAEVPGVEVVFPTGFFKEFVVRFDGTGKTVAQVNEALMDKGIFGGKDISADFPGLGRAALYCITEIHGQAEIDRLVDALKEAVR